MSTKTATPPNSVAKTLIQEHNLTIDGVIELANYIDEQDFFNGLLAIIIDYIEQHGGMAALSLDRK